MLIYLLSILLLGAVPEGHGETRIKEWREMIKHSKNLKESKQIKIVNQFFNMKIHYKHDIYIWNKMDYWATPIELLTKGAGDCEDYAIAKYFTLLKMGVHSRKLKIHYVEALKLNQHHMVLSYKPKNSKKLLILDNLITDIKPKKSRRDLRFIYNFSDNGLWLANRNKRVGKSNTLTMWRDLKKRMK